MSFKALSFSLNSFKHLILLSSWGLISVVRMPSSASDATVGVDLNNLRMRDRARLYVDSSSFRLELSKIL